MANCQRKRAQKNVDFAYALRSFLGYLEGTGKALHTIRNYRSDLMSFEEFLEKGLGSKRVPLNRLTRADLEKFHSHLKAQGFRTNTRRRKMLTLRRLIRYLARRNKLALDVADQLPAPAKVERVPRTISTGSLLESVRGLSEATVLDARNRALLWTLAETGCRVSEISEIRGGSLSGDGHPPAIHFEGKFARKVPISRELHQTLERLASARDQAIFTGHNRYGSLGSAISPRGVELLVKAYAPRLELEDPTPRLFRHSAVLAWHSGGVDQPEIQRRLGLRTDYSFRMYAPLFKKRDT